LGVGGAASRFQPRAPHFVQLRLHLRHPLELHFELAPKIVDDLAPLIQHLDDVVVLSARDVRAVEGRLPEPGGLRDPRRRLASALVRHGAQCLIVATAESIARP
jgi:hypothetical protein